MPNRDLFENQRAQYARKKRNENILFNIFMGTVFVIGVAAAVTVLCLVITGIYLLLHNFG